MKITAVRATSHSISLQAPLLKEPKEETFVCVRLETDEGIGGVGFLAGYFTRIVMRDVVNNLIGPVILGLDPMDPEAVMAAFIKKFDLRRTIGILTHAMSGIDCALWDLKGKALNQPVYRLLGGHSARVPVYATFGLIDYSRQQLAEAAKIHIAQGHDKLKMVVGINASSNVPEDAARVRTVREAIGDKIQLMVDANQKFSLLQATQLVRLIEPYNISWFEEPLTHNYPPEMRVLRSRTSIPLAAGQVWEYGWQNLQFMEARALDIAQTDVGMVGGFTEGIKVAHLAQAFDLPLATHGWPRMNMHLAAATPVGHRVEFHVLQEALEQAIFVTPTKPENGWVTCPSKPGLGLELNEDVLKKCQDKA